MHRSIKLEEFKRVFADWINETRQVGRGHFEGSINPAVFRASLFGETTEKYTPLSQKRCSIFAQIAQALRDSCARLYNSEGMAAQ